MRIIACPCRDGKAPNFIEKPTIRMVGKTKIIMRVVLEAKPEPTITWYKGDKVLSAGGKVAIFMNRASAADSYELICEIAVS